MVPFVVLQYASDVAPSLIRDMNPYHPKQASIGTSAHPRQQILCALAFIRNHQFSRTSSKNI
eukprot:3657623-Pyramimonas_sp.AAC.1